VNSVVLSYMTGLAVSPDGQRLYVSAEDATSNVFAIDVPTATIVGAFPAEANAVVVVSPDSSTLYTTNDGDSTTQYILEQISAATLTVLNSVTVAAETSYAGDGTPLAISPDGSSLAVFAGPPAASVTLFALPALTKSAVSPSGSACGIAYPSPAEIALTSCVADVVDVIDLTTQTVVKQLDAGPSPFYSLSDNSGGVLYVSNADGVWALSPASGKVLNQIALSSTPSLALSSDGKTLFAATSNSVARISTATTKLLGDAPGIPAGSFIYGVATSPSGPYLFVSVGNGLLVLDQATGNLVGSYAAPVTPEFLVSSPDGSTVYYEGIPLAGGPFLYSFNVAAGTFSSLGIQVSGTLVMSPDGRTLYISSPLESYDIATGVITPNIFPGSSVLSGAHTGWFHLSGVLVF